MVDEETRKRRFFRNDSANKLAMDEFKNLGFDEKFRKIDTDYLLEFRTPLGKPEDSKTIGIELDKLKSRRIFIIALQNPMAVLSHFFYVFDKAKHWCEPFLSGNSSEWQFINVVIDKFDDKDIHKKVGEVSLPTAREYLTSVQKNLIDYIEKEEEIE